MTAKTLWTPDPKLDLVLDRVVDVPRALVWKAWTEPQHLMKWFTPAPWKTTACTIDLQPGGAFLTTMQSPEGQEFHNVGCILEVVPQERLVMTDTLGPGFRPSEKPFFSCVLTLEDAGKGSTRYVATAIHGTDAAKQQHEAMGFHNGWGTALDQLVAFAKTL